MSIGFTLNTPFNASAKTCSFVKGIYVLQDKFFLLKGLSNEERETMSDEKLMAAVLADEEVRESYYVHIEIVHATYFSKQYRFVIIAGIAPSQNLDRAQDHQKRVYMIHKHLFNNDCSVEYDVAEAACKHYGIRWQR